MAPPPRLRRFHTSRLPGLWRTALPRIVWAGGLPCVLVVVDRQHSRACADTQAHQLLLSRSEKEPLMKSLKKPGAGLRWVHVWPGRQKPSRALSSFSLAWSARLHGSVRRLASGNRLSFSLHHAQCSVRTSVTSTLTRQRFLCQWEKSVCLLSQPPRNVRVRPPPTYMTCIDEPLPPLLKI